MLDKPAHAFAAVVVASMLFGCSGAPSSGAMAVDGAAPPLSVGETGRWRNCAQCLTGSKN
jgi:hypothetical protein